jgi:hypothetical protein
MPGQRPQQAKERNTMHRPASRTGMCDAPPQGGRSLRMPPTSAARRPFRPLALALTSSTHLTAVGHPA